MRLSLSTTSTWLLAAALGTAAPAQIPDGWYVTSSFQWPAITGAPGPAGLYVGHPVIPATGLMIGGLSPVLNSACTSTGSTTARGTDFVVQRPSDGALITDSFCLTVPSPLDLHVITVTGSPATGFTGTVIRTIPLGTLNSVNDLGVPQAALLPDNKTLIVAVDRLAGPLAGAILGSVDLVAGTVTPISVTYTPPGRANALAVDPVLGAAYLGMDGAGQIWRVPLAGGMPTLVATLPTGSGIATLAVDSKGNLIAGGLLGLFQINTTTLPATPQPIPSGVASVNGVVVERATGDYLVVGHMTRKGVFGVYRVTPAGVTTQIGTPSSSGWGTLAGIDLDPDPETYGPATPTMYTYAWDTALNPGGLPRIGNASFGLRLTTTNPNPGNVATALLASTSQGSFPVLNLQILLGPPIVDLGSGVAFSPQGVAVLPLSLQGLPAGALGQSLYFQTVHLDPTGLGASNGLCMTIMN